MNSIKRRYSLLKFISLWLLIILILLLSSFSIYYYNARLVVVNEVFAIKVKNIKNITNNSIKNFLWNCDNKLLNQMVDALFVDEDLQSVKIYDEKGIVIVQKSRSVDIINNSNVLQDEYTFMFEEVLIADGLKIGKIECVFSKEKYYDRLYSSLASFFLFSFILLLILTSLATVFIKIIIKSLTSLATSAQIIANGELDFKIEENSFSEINFLVKNFTKMQLSLKKMVNENRNLVANLESKIKERTEVVNQAYLGLEEKSKKISFLFNHLEEGVFQINSDLKIDVEFSRYCLDLFGEDIAGKKISELFNENNNGKSEFLENIFYDILINNDVEKRNIFISLLPQEIKIKKKNLKISYVYSFDLESKLIVFVKDISRSKRLKKIQEKDSKKLNMLIKVIRGYDDFITLINEYTLFFENLKSNRDIKFDVSDFFLKIHTFKGNFSQYCMDDIVEFLHKQEDFCQRAVENKETTEIDFFDFFNPENFQIQLKNNLKYIREILGENYFLNEPKYEITKSELDSMSLRCKCFLNDIEAFWVNSELNRIKMRSFNKMFYPYIEYLRNISLKMGKKVYELKIKGGNFLVNPEILEPLVRSFVHILRNSIVHGIEFPGDRVSKSKKEFGNVTITLNRDLNKNCLILLISDDGAGLDLAKIKKQIVNMGFELDNFKTESELNNSIFLEKMSTSNQVDLFSGRGIGLSAVKKEVEKLNGKIDIISKKDFGTKFKFFIPYYFDDESVLKQFEKKENLAKEMVDIFKTSFNIKSENSIVKHIRNVKFVKGALLKYRIKGVCNLEIFINISNNLLNSLGNKYSEELKKDFLKESLNLVISKSIQEYDSQKYLNFTLDSIIKIESSLKVDFENEIIIYKNKSESTDFKIVFTNLV